MFLYIFSRVFLQFSDPEAIANALALFLHFKINLCFLLLPCLKYTFLLFFPTYLQGFNAYFSFLLYYIVYCRIKSFPEN